MTENDYFSILIRLLLAALAGGLIGFERSYHGRPAGFRTHTLVCTASGLLMLLTAYQWPLLSKAPLETLSVDPTRMAQGIMTGIGFLGAGVIMKEGLSIRGLTTAGSVWITAAIGILIGIGFYFPAAVGTVLTLGILSFFRWIEAIIPSLHYGRFNIRFLRQDILPQTELNALVQVNQISVANLNYRLLQEGNIFEYEMTIRTKDKDNFQRLAERLTAIPKVLEFQITPTGD